MAFLKDVANLINSREKMTRYNLLDHENDT